MASRCEQAANWFHSMCVEFGKHLTYLRCIEDNHDHKNLTVELKSYKHYVRVFSELKVKCGATGGVVLIWPALQAGTKACMFLPEYCVSKSLYTQFHNSLIEHLKYLVMLRMIMQMSFTMDQRRFLGFVRLFSMLFLKENHCSMIAQAKEI